MTSPAYMTPTRSQTFTITPRLCEMYRSAVVYWRRRSAIRSITAASTVTSRAVVGSSKTSSAGLVSIAMAITIRCCWPPDSWWG